MPSAPSGYEKPSGSFSFLTVGMRRIKRDADRRAGHDAKIGTETQSARPLEQKLARGFLIARSLAVLPDKLFQSFWIGLRPNGATLKTGVALRVQLRAVVQGNSEKPETFRSEHDVREILVAGPRDLSFSDLRPPHLKHLVISFGYDYTTIGS